MAAGADTGAVRVTGASTGVRTGAGSGIGRGAGAGAGAGVAAGAAAGGESLLLRQVHWLRSFAALCHLVDRRRHLC